MRCSIKGVIVSNDEKWMYDWLGMDATSPKDIHDAIREANGEQIDIDINSGGGNVFDQLRARAGQINEQLGRQVVTMTGARTDINGIVAAGDVFVGVSRAALEAMAAAKPVIVAGNEGYQGLFGPDKLAEAMLGNFC